MRNYRKWFLLIYSSCLFAIFGAAILVRDLWIHHDSSNLLLHMSLLLNIAVLMAAMIWAEERWKYFRISVFVVFLVCLVFATIHAWHKGDAWGYIFYPIWFLWGLYRLKEEITKLMTISDFQEKNNELLSGSMK